jgi:hypothetical protein
MFLRYGTATADRSSAKTMAMAEAYPRFKELPLLKIYTLRVWEE